MRIVTLLRAGVVGLVILLSVDVAPAAAQNSWGFGGGGIRRSGYFGGSGGAWYGHRFHRYYGGGAAGDLRAPALDQQTQSVGPASPWTPFLLAGVDIYSFSYGTDVAVTGGARLQRDISPRLRVFGQGTAGLLHGGGANDFTLIPGGGVMLPIASRPFEIVAGLNFPIDFFSGGHQSGPQFYGGLAFSLGQ